MAWQWKVKQYHCKIWKSLSSLFNKLIRQIQTMDLQLNEIVAKGEALLMVYEYHLQYAG